jgi:hypothetical protein
METTTIRVSKKTAEALENVKENLNAKNLDDTIQSLLKDRRSMFLKQVRGIDRGKLKPFSEADRGEDRS